MYGTNITRFENDFVPFETYLVSTAYVCDSINAYGEPIHQFTWTIDHSTIAEPIKEVIPPEQPLLPPTQLQLASFDSFEYQPIGFEFAIVINGSPPSYASNGSRIQEFFIIDYRCGNFRIHYRFPLPTTYPIYFCLIHAMEKTSKAVTLREEFIDVYWNKILTHLKEHEDFLVILARKVAKPKSSSGLSNRLGTTIHINPPYPQAIELKTWSNEIKPQLSSYITKSTTATGFVCSIRGTNHTIGNIQQQPSELVSKQVLLYNLPSINTSHTQRVF